MKLIKHPLISLIFITTILVGCDSVHLKNSDAHKITKQDTEIKPPPPVASPIIPIEPTFANVWDHIRAGYGLPETSNSTIDAQIHFYTRNKNYFYKVTQESEPYLYYVVSEMQANDMPTELALLPFIESSYNPLAASASNAGMWQFGAGTGRVFGLKQNSWYDGRKDLIASTDAAIRLLKKLCARFDNDWLLAIAAYNAGDGTIQQAIDKNKRAGKPIDFWSLPLNKTTQGYIPQLLALSKIVANPNIYDFKLYPIPDLPYFVKINVDTQINLIKAAQDSAIDTSLFKKLNAGFRKGLTYPNEQRQLLVPVDAAANFTLQLNSQPKITNVKWQEYIVTKGDSLDAISKKYGVDIATIKSINDIKNSTLSIGQRLQIPASTAHDNTTNYAREKTIINESQSIKENTHNNDSAPKSNKYYTVKAGENLWSIAKAQHMTVNALAQLNNINTKSPLQLGQKILVATPTNTHETTETYKETHKLSYTIKLGDTLGRIAEKYDVSVKQIMQWNKIKDETNIQPNQVLIVGVDAQ